MAKAVRETEDRAFSAHALALEDAATAQQQRHRQALADAIAACEARHAEALDQRRRRDVALAASLRGAKQRAKGPQHVAACVEINQCVRPAWRYIYYSGSLDAARECLAS